MSNLIKNGDFSQQGTDWTASNPELVRYETGHCIIGAPESISQEVPTRDGGQFMLSATIKTLDGAAARIVVTPHPTGESVFINVGGSQDWKVYSEKFTVQKGTIKFTVTLEANDGEFGKLESFFANVNLSLLP